MSTADQREPTNDELWAQPPTIPNTPVAGYGLAPIQHTQAPMQHTQAPMPLPVAPQALPAQDRTAFVLAIVSFVLGVPLTAIASGTAGLPGLLVVWTGIVLVNFFYARSRRH